MQTIVLDGQSLTREQVVAVAHGSSVRLDATQLEKVQLAADFLAEQVRRRSCKTAQETANGGAPRCGDDDVAHEFALGAESFTAV